MTNKGMVVTPQPEAMEAGRDILAGGVMPSTPLSRPRWCRLLSTR